jgi:hypothetical protein
MHQSINWLIKKDALTSGCSASSVKCRKNTEEHLIKYWSSEQTQKFNNWVEIWKSFVTSLYRYHQPENIELI